MVLPAGVALAMFANIQRSFASTNSSQGRTLLSILNVHGLEKGCCRLLCRSLCLPACGAAANQGLVLNVWQSFWMCVDMH